MMGDQWNYSLEDAADDPEKNDLVEAEDGLEEELQAYYSAIPEDDKGLVWVDSLCGSVFHKEIFNCAS